MTTRTSNSYIQLENITKSYVSGKITTPVLKGIDLEIDNGEFISIMGPSGSGKSTLLYLLGGLEPATDGSVWIKQKLVQSMKDKEISQMRSQTIGFVFQFYNLVPHLTVEDNIMLPALLSGKKKKVLMEKMDSLLKIVGLTEKKNALPSELSGGQQQRVAIARALIQEPEIILADEPIGNLDSKSGQDIMELFQTINQEKNITIIQVTHSQESAEYGDRIIHLKDGVISHESYIKKDKVLA